MLRRPLLVTLAAWPAVRLAAQPEAKRPHHKIPASQLLEALSARFPLRFAVPGVMDLVVGDPALLLLATRNKLGSALQLEARGPALRDQVKAEVDVLFGLRYEPGDRTVRTQDPEVQLWGAVGAVFSSWMSARAVTYRQLHNIPEGWGTAVNIQARFHDEDIPRCRTKQRSKPCWSNVIAASVTGARSASARRGTRPLGAVNPA